MTPITCLTLVPGLRVGVVTAAGRRAQDVTWWRTDTVRTLP